ncbi:hypothetical protein COBT_002554 [Conglomerata obtusa]
MDQYFGATLLFKTKNKTISGILKGLTDDNSRMLILTNNNLIKLSILDIDDLQIVDTGNAKEKDTSEFEKTITEYRQSITLESKENFIGDKFVAKKNDEQNCIKKNKIENQKEITEKNELINIKNDNSYPNDISLKDYFDILEDTFAFYGPSKESFISNVGETLLEFFLDKGDNVFCIILSDNSIYTCIGFYIAKRFLDKNIKFDLIYNNPIQHKDVARHKNYYINSGGIITRKLQQNYDNIIVGDNSCKIFNISYINNAYYLSYNSTKLRNSVIFNYGIVIAEINRDIDEAYLIDCGFGNFIYQKYNLKKCIKKIDKIK